MYRGGIVVAVCAAVACSDSTRAASTADAGDDAGSGPEDVIGDAGAAPFVDVAAALGLPSAGGVCVVFDDFDGDARPDVFVTSFAGAPQAAGLWINDGKGGFAAHPLAPIAFTSKEATTGWCAAGDIDADGKLDVVVAAFPGFDAHLLRNAGGGAFTDVQTVGAGVPGAISYSAVALADFDGDGWLDLVVAPYRISPPHDPSACGKTPDGFACGSDTTRCAPPPLVFRNDGSGRFGSSTSVTSDTDCGPANANAFGVVDWNGDGRADLFVANDWGTNRFYVNGGSLKFTDVWPSLGAKTYNHGMGVAFEDFDLDGKLDFYVSDLGSDQLYLGTGSGVARHGVDWGVAAPTRLKSGWAASAEDFDSDGVPDVLVANAAFVDTYTALANAGAGVTADSRPQWDLLLHGEGRAFTPRWVKQSADASPYASFGAVAVADYDGDGLLDVAEAVGYPMRFQLLHNVGAKQHWLRVRLHGRAPNVDGIGATVTVARPGKPAWTRYVTRSRGSVGGSWATLHFGLGASTAIDRVDVRWPDGTTQTVTAPSADAVLAVTQ